MRVKNTRGFTLIELMVVIAIFSVITFIAIGVGAGGFTKNQITVEAENLTSILRVAQSRSVSGHQGDVWGVHMTSSDFTLFLGNDYATRDTAYDEVRDLPSGIVASGLTDVVFEIRSGETSNTGTITLTNSDTGDTVTLTINQHGRVTK